MWENETTNMFSPFSQKTAVKITPRFYETGLNDLQVLGIGDMDREEFAVVVADLQAQTEFQRVSDITAAIAFVSEPSSWNSVDRTSVRLIVLFQARNGVYCQSEVERLRRSTPFTPMVNVLGSLSEGEVRTGVPLHGCVRIYWHQWKLQGRRQLDLLRKNLPSHWTLPATTTEDERILYDIAAIPSSETTSVSYQKISSFSWPIRPVTGSISATLPLSSTPSCPTE